MGQVEQYKLNIPDCLTQSYRFPAVNGLMATGNIKDVMTLKTATLNLKP